MQTKHETHGPRRHSDRARWIVVGYMVVVAIGLVTLTALERNTTQRIERIERERIESVRIRLPECRPDDRLCRVAVEALRDAVAVTGSGREIPVEVEREGDRSGPGPKGHSPRPR